jgi:hypothetical protein
VEATVFTRARQAFLVAALVVSPAAAYAQATWQPTSPPLLTAQNEPWFLAGAPIIWAGDYYYPAGTPRFLSPNEMVRSGSFRGIPLYTDATLDPYSIVYVPMAGGLMQPYQRRRDGDLAGTSGSTTPAFPPAPATEMVQAPHAAGVAEMEGLREAPAPPAYARAYDVAPPGPEMTVRQAPIATSGRTPPAAPEGPVETAERPQGINGIWVTYEGQRWFAAGETMVLTEGHFSRIGTYHGFPVYRRGSDTSRIYIPAADGLVSPFTSRR